MKIKYNKGAEEAKLPKKISEAMEDEDEYKPHFDLTSEQLKAVKDWQVGKTYTVEMKIKQTRKTETDDDVMACFDVEKIKEI